MSTPSLIPVFDPQGTLRDIPEDQLRAAVNAGGTPAVKFQAPDKKIRFVPANKTQDAVKAGGTLLPFEQQDVKHPGFWHELASDLTGMVSGLAEPDPLADPRVSDQEKSHLVAQQQAQAAATNAERAKQHGAGYSWTASAGEMLGVPVSGMEQSAEQGDVGGVLGHAATVPTVLALSAGAPKVAEAAKGPLEKSVRVAVKAANKALEKAPGSVGASIGASLGAGATHVTGIPGLAEVGGVAGYGLGKELLPTVRLPGEGFGLPNRVQGGPAVAPQYEAPALQQAITELGPRATVPSVRARAAEIQAAANKAVGYKPPEPGKPIYQRPTASDLAFNRMNPPEQIPEHWGLDTSVPKKIALDTDAFAQAMQQARKELGPKALVKDVIARRDEILGGRPVTGDIGEQSRQANPEPTRAETKSAQLASPGATEVKATSRTSRGTANTAASEQSQPEPRTPPPPGESTAVDSFKYDADKQEIHVVGKNGRTYVYGEVTPEQAQMFHEAESKGMAWKAIKDNNPYVAKIIDGKRTAIRRGPTSANPDDLTPQLEESLKQALRKKR